MAMLACLPACLRARSERPGQRVWGNREMVARRFFADCTCWGERKGKLTAELGVFRCGSYLLGELSMRGAAQVQHLLL